MRFATTLSILALVVGTSVAQAADTKTQRSVDVGVGDTEVLKAARNNDCGDTAPDWEYVLNKLPETELGIYVDGGVGTTYSRSCGGSVAARIILFQASTSGRDTLDIVGDKIKIKVK